MVIKLFLCPEGFETVAESDNCPHATMQHLEQALFGVQFHPEVVHTPQGALCSKNLLMEFAVAQAIGEMAKFVEHTIAKVKETVGDDHILLGLSGGVDSSVVAALLHKAIGDQQLHCVYVDNGLMRYNETKEIKALFGDAMDLHVVHARVVPL